MWYNCTQKIEGQVCLDALVPLQMLKCIVILYSGKHKKCKYSEIRGETEEKVGIISVNGNSCLYGTKPGGVVLLLHIYCCN